MENAHCQFVGGGSSFIVASQDETATDFFKKISSPNFNGRRTSAHSSSSLPICAEKVGLQKQGTDAW